MIKFMGLAYIAGPVRNIGREQAIIIRADAERFLTHRGYTTFNPAGAWCGDGENKHSELALQAINDHIVGLCSLVVAVLIKGVSSPGTDHELQVALRNGKPIMVLLQQVEGISDFVAQISRLVGESRSEVENEVTFCVFSPDTGGYELLYTVNYEPVLEIEEVEETRLA